jgi:acyl carrier protein
MTDPLRLRKEIAALFTEQLHVDVPWDDTDLFETGVLDSLKFVELLVQLEQQFGTRVSLDDLELDNFRSIGQIAHFIVGRRGPPGATEQVQG